jgi:hypothetical protein
VLSTKETLVEVWEESFKILEAAWPTTIQGVESSIRRLQPQLIVVDFLEFAGIDYCFTHQLPYVVFFSGFTLGTSHRVFLVSLFLFPFLYMNRLCRF